MKKYVFLLGVIVGLLAIGTEATAYSCSPRPCKVQLEEAEMVFKGKAHESGSTTDAMQAEYQKNKGPTASEHDKLPSGYTEFEILEIYKGAPDKKVRIFYEVHNPNRRSMIAGYSVPPAYENGSEAVVYAYFKNGFLTTWRGPCSSCAGDGTDLETIRNSLDAMDALIRLYPKTLEFYQKKIELLENNKDFAQARTVYETALTVVSDEDKKKLLIDYGRALYESRAYERAISILEPYKGKEDQASTYTQLSLIQLKRSSELTGQKLLMAAQELSDVTIQDADLSGSDFTGAKLTNVKLVNVKLRGANFTNTQLQVEVTGSDFEGAHFDNAKLRGKILDSKFDKAIFAKAELDLGETSRNSFKGADFDEGKLHIMEGRMEAKGWEGSDYSGARFTGTNIGGIGKSKTTGADFTGASFYSGRTPSSRNEGLDLSGQKLDNSKLDSSDFTGGSFKGASLKNATFTGSNLNSVDFSNADLTGADFTVSRYSGTTKLNGANFTGAKIESVKWEGAIFDCKTKFPAGFDTLAQQLEPADVACAKQPPLGMIPYTKERFYQGNINVCNGNYHAACIYGFIINFSLVMETGGYTSRRIHKFYEVARSLVDAGELDLARLILYRSYAEHINIYGKDRTIGSDYFSLLKEAGAKYKGPSDEEADAGFRQPKKRGTRKDSQREAALAFLQAGDKEKARATMIEALAEIKNYPQTDSKMDRLLEYADIFARIEGGLKPELVKELEKVIRATPYLHFERRNKDGVPPADYVALGEKLLSERSAP